MPKIPLTNLKMGGRKHQGCASATSDDEYVILAQLQDPDVFPYVREIADSDVTIYVSTASGSDSTGDGTSSNPYATIQKGVDTLVSAYDLGSYTGTVSVAAGTYSENVELKTPQPAGAECKIEGNTTTPGNVVIDSTSVGSVFAFDLATIGTWAIDGFKIKSGRHAVRANGPGSTISVDNLEIDELGSAGAILFARRQSLIDARSAAITLTSDINNSGYAYYAWDGAVISVADTTFDANSYTFATNTFAYARRHSYIQGHDGTYSNVSNVTGKRYQSNYNSTIYVDGAGASYFPGDAAGTTTADGVYA